MIQSYLPVVVLLGLVILFLVGSFVASSILGPKRRTMAKTAPYESGIVTNTELPARFSVKFYLIAIAFIVVDVEVIFLFPFSTIFADKVVDGVLIEGLGTAGLGVIGIFLGILIVPFAYLLASGALSFGPKTPKVNSANSPIIKSQGFNRSTSDTASSETRAFAASEETSGSERPEGRETAIDSDEVASTEAAKKEGDA